MSRNRNAKSPTAALHDRITATHNEMRGAPGDPDSGSNPWDLMLKAEDTSPRPHRLPRFDWTYLVMLLIVAALVIGLVLWLS